MSTRLAAIVCIAWLGVLLVAGGVFAQSVATPAVEIAQSASPTQTPQQQTPAQQTEPNKRSIFGKRAPGASQSPPSGVFAWLMQKQQQLHRELAAAVKGLKTGNPLSAALLLGFVAFSYGVLHAAGPGHGKAVISSYVLANERTVKRGIALSFLAAGIQGLSALVIVGLLVLVLRSTSMEIKAAEGWIETVSWALVTLIGLWLLTQQVRAIISGWQGRAAAEHGTHSHGGAGDQHQHQHGHHDHAHAHGCGCGHEHHHADHDHADDNHAHHGQSHHHAHDHGGHGHAECCGHAHMPSPEQLQGAWSWPRALAVAFSVGIRPCTGAIVVLVFAISQGLMWAGVFATFAMALGTAITVSALAALAVGSREFATRMAGEGSRWGWRIERAAGVVGAVLVTVLGAAFFMGSLQPAAPF